MGDVQLGDGIGELKFQSMGKDFCPNFPQPLLEHFDRRSCNDGIQGLNPVFHNPHRKRCPTSDGGSYHRVPCRGVL